MGGHSQLRFIMGKGNDEYYSDYDTDRDGPFSCVLDACRATRAPSHDDLEIHWMCADLEFLVETNADVALAVLRHHAFEG